MYMYEYGEECSLTVTWPVSPTLLGQPGCRFGEMPFSHFLYTTAQERIPTLVEYRDSCCYDSMTGI